MNQVNLSNDAQSQITKDKVSEQFITPLYPTENITYTTNVQTSSTLNAQKTENKHNSDGEVESKKQQFKELQTQLETEIKSKNELTIRLQKNKQKYLSIIKDLQVQLENTQNELQKLKEMKEQEPDQAMIKKIKDIEQLNQDIKQENFILTKQILELYEKNYAQDLSNETIQQIIKQSIPKDMQLQKNLLCLQIQKSQQLETQFISNNHIIIQNKVSIQSIANLQRQDKKQLVSFISENQEKGESSNHDLIQKFQKKLLELENIIKEKERNIIDKEKEIFDLQNKINKYDEQGDETQQLKRESQTKIDTLMRELKYVNEQKELLIYDFHHQLKAKDQNLNEYILQIQENTKQLKIHQELAQKHEQIVAKYQDSLQLLDHQNKDLKVSFNNLQQEAEHLKIEFDNLVIYKQDLEYILQDQDSKLLQKSNKVQVLEDILRQKDLDLSNKSDLLRKFSSGADDQKRKITQAELKLRQVTQTTVKDLKMLLRDKNTEIEVLKEMLISANKQLRMYKEQASQKRNLYQLQRKYQIVNDKDSASSILNQRIYFDSSERQHQQFKTPRKILDQYQNSSIGRDSTKNNDANSIKAQTDQKVLLNRNSISRKNLRNLRQQYLDQQFEQDTRSLTDLKKDPSIVFQKKIDEKFDIYLNNFSQQSNYRNNSQSIKSLFSDNQVGNEFAKNYNQNLQQHLAILPRLNQSKIENQLGLINQQTVMNKDDSSELIRNENKYQQKYYSPNLKLNQQSKVYQVIHDQSLDQIKSNGIVLNSMSPLPLPANRKRIRKQFS